LLNSAPQPVSNSFLSSLKVWIEKNIPTGKTRKGNTMFVMKLASAVLAISMVFGGASTAVQAAEGSLPGQMMYQLKIMVEDAQETMSGNTMRVQLSLDQVETRIQEMLRLREQDKDVPEAAFTRLNKQLEKTLGYMAGLSDDELTPLLDQVRTRLMAQDQLLQQLQSQAQGSEDAVLDRIRKMLQDRLHVIDDGMQDAQQFKLEVQDRDRDRTSWEEENPPANNEAPGNGPGYQNEGAGDPGQNGTGTCSGSGDCEPAGEPSGSGEGAGPGPGEGEPSATCTPVQDGTGPGPGPGEGEPSATCTPVQDGTGPGPGPGEGDPSATCTPVEDGTGSGPGPGAGEVTPSGTPLQDGTGPGPGPGAGETPTPGGSGSGSKP
jgi:hypothetical protein